MTGATVPYNMSSVVQGRLGRYVILKHLNRGGMADVYLAKAAGFGGIDQIVVLKTIRSEVATDTSFVDMFVNEAKLAVLLDHPNIAHTYELGRIDGVHFIAMEFIQGRDLRAVLDRLASSSKPLPMELALYIVAEVCEGLDYAHRKADLTGKSLQIVHRDVSPHNVLISYDGEIKLIDFGVARAATQALESREGQLKGKYGYMSPEQMRAERVDGRSDVFSAGVVLYELLTGERLYDGASDASVIDKVRNAEVFPPRVMVPRIGVAAENVVLQALAFDRDVRFGSASDMREAIVEVLLTQGLQPSQRDLRALMQDLFAEDHTRDLRWLEQARQIGVMAEPTAPEPSPGLETTEITSRKRVERSPVFDGSEPTEILPVPEHRWRREIWILATAVVAAVSLVLASWVMTRKSAPAPQGGLVVLSTPADAEVLIDGTKVGTTPFSSSAIGGGAHSITVRRTGYASISETVQIAPHKVVELRYTMRAQ